MNYTLNEALFWSRVELSPTGCWLWRGAQARGYGICVVKLNSGGWTNRRVHRVVLELAGHDIPEGHEVDHLCVVSLCLNPEHLEIVTSAENRRRVWPRLNPLHATHCLRGHPRTPENTRRNSGGTVCRICEGRGPRRKRSPTHCLNGHLWTPENTRINSKGSRTCRVCHRLTAHPPRGGETVGRGWRKRARRPDYVKGTKIIPFQPTAIRFVLGLIGVEKIG